jgi:peptidoglycan-associated lipoprotein
MQIQLRVRQILFSGVIAVTLAAGACGGNPPPEVEPTPPPMPTAPPPVPIAPPTPVEPPRAVQPEPVLEEEPLIVQSLDELNRESPLVPVFFGYDSSEIGSDAQSDLQRNATTLRQYSSWVITVEGHCDERGTAEYNLALGERRALAARDYLISLGISEDRLRTVSYGEEFPFAAGQDEEAWQLNRRAHFVITAQ